MKTGRRRATHPTSRKLTAPFSLSLGGRTPSKRRREIILPKSTAPLDTRPIRAETRAKLIASIARGWRWLDEIAAGAVTDVEQIAAREKCSVRKVNMTISLAFLVPDLVKAAVEGCLPRAL